MPQQLFDSTLRGFGDLSSALLMAPQLARRNRLEQEAAAQRKQAHMETLAQALQIHDDAVAARDQAHQDLEAQRKDRNDLAERNFSSLDEARKSEAEKRKSDMAQQWVKTVAGGLKGALSMVGAGKKSSASAERPYDYHTSKDKTLRETKSTGELTPVDDYGNPIPDPNKPVFSPSGQRLELSPQGGYIPVGGVPNQLPTPNVAGASPFTMRTSGAPGIHTLGDVLSGRFGAMESQPGDDTEGQPESAPTSVVDEGPDLSGLSPEDQESFRQVLKQGNPAQIAAATRKLQSMRR